MTALSLVGRTVLASCALVLLAGCGSQIVASSEPSAVPTPASAVVPSAVDPSIATAVDPTERSLDCNPFSAGSTTLFARPFTSLDDWRKETDWVAEVQVVRHVGDRKGSDAHLIPGELPNAIRIVEVRVLRSVLGDVEPEQLLTIASQSVQGGVDPSAASCYLLEVGNTALIGAVDSDERDEAFLMDYDSVLYTYEGEIVDSTRQTPFFQSLEAMSVAELVAVLQEDPTEK